MNQTDPFGVVKFAGLDRKSARQRSRKQNAGRHAAAGAAIYGGLGVAGGGAVGASRARGGLRDLGRLDAAPSRARSAGIVAGTTARKATKAGLPLAVAGGLYGAGIGATLPHRKTPVHKSAVGVDLGPVAKARFDNKKMKYGARLMVNGMPHQGGRLFLSGATGVARDPATHAALQRTAAATGGVGAGVLVGAGVRNHRRRQAPVAKSAFGVDLGVAKRAPDRRDAGLAIGSGTALAGGARLGAASRRASRAALIEENAGRSMMHGASPHMLARGADRLADASRYQRMARRSRVGATGLLTAGAAVGGMLVQRSRKPVQKSAFGVDLPDSQDG